MENEVELHKIPIKKMTSLQFAGRIIQILQGSIDDGAITFMDWRLAEWLDQWNARATPSSPLTEEEPSLLTWATECRDAALKIGSNSNEFDTVIRREYRVRAQCWQSLIDEINRRASELMAVATTGETGSVRFAIDFTIKSKEPLSESLTFLALRNIGRSDFVLYCYEPETGNCDAVAAPGSHSEIVGAAMDYMVNDEDYSREELFVDLAITTEKESS